MASIVGTWTITTNFGCDGDIAGLLNQTFNADGTWINAIGSEAGGIKLTVRRMGFQQRG